MTATEFFERYPNIERIEIHRNNNRLTYFFSGENPDEPWSRTEFSLESQTRSDMNELEDTVLGPVPA